MSNDLDLTFHPDTPSDAPHRLTASARVLGTLMNFTAIRVMHGTTEYYDAVHPQDHEELSALFDLAQPDGPSQTTAIPGFPGWWLIYATPAVTP